jgi:hypothetical protein
MAQVVTGVSLTTAGFDTLSFLVDKRMYNFFTWVL